MLREFRIMDADAHVVEPVDMWAKYIDPEFRDLAPYTDESQMVSVMDSSGNQTTYPNPVKGLKVNGKHIYNKISEDIWLEGTKTMIKNYTDSAYNKFDPASQVETLKAMGNDLSFMYPTVGLWMLAIDDMDPQLASALMRAYNNWLKDYCSYDPNFLHGVGAICLHDPVQIVEEVKRIAGFGWKAVFIRPNPVKGRLLSDPAYEPFWTACEDLDISVSIHEGTHCRLPATGSDRFNTRFAMHACSHPMEQMMAMLALIEGGVLERHPRLKFAFLEAGCGWLPYWLWRLDELEYSNLGWEVRENVRMKPSEYFRRQCFISIEPDEPYVKDIIKYIGEDNILFGSDFPHMDHHPDIMDEIVALEKSLSREIVQKILWDNPMRYYGMKL
jgi:uncharacterized protein